MQLLTTANTRAAPNSLMENALIVGSYTAGNIETFVDAKSLARSVGAIFGKNRIGWDNTSLLENAANAIGVFAICASGR